MVAVAHVERFVVDAVLMKQVMISANFLIGAMRNGCCCNGIKQLYVFCEEGVFWAFIVERGFPNLGYLCRQDVVEAIFRSVRSFGWPWKLARQGRCCGLPEIKGKPW